MPGNVLVSYLHPPTVGANFHTSLLGLVLHDLTHHHHIGMTVPQLCASSGHVTGRNRVAELLLDELPGMDWLFWLDADMGFSADTLDKLLDAADPEERPVVGALAFAWTEVAEDGLGGYHQRAVPTIYDFTDVGGDRGRRFLTRPDYPRDTLVQCAATGSACIVLHRSALEAVRDEYGPHWYDRIGTPDGYMGEDVSLCARLGALGIPVHVDTRVKTNHQKTVYVAEPMFDPETPRPVAY